MKTQDQAMMAQENREVVPRVNPVQVPWPQDRQISQG